MNHGLIVALFCITHAAFHVFATTLINTVFIFRLTLSVRMMKNCERGPRTAILSPRSQFFTVRPANSMFIFSCRKLVLQITNEFVYTALVIQWAYAPSTNDLEKVLAANE